MEILKWECESLIIANAIRKNIGWLKIILKTRDENFLLRSWIEHHIKIVGAGNLIIADNMSSNNEVFQIYNDYKEDVVVFQFSGNHNDIHASPRFSELYSALRDSSKYVVFLDTDERLTWFEGGRWFSDSRVVDFIQSSIRGRAIPGAWLVNAPESFDSFFVGTDQQNLNSNLKWGKPIISASILGTQPIIHNAQFDNNIFDDSDKTNVIILHLTQFPERRLMTNRYKLINRGIVSENETIDDILRRSFEEFSDISFMPLVNEMREMLNLRNNFDYYQNKMKEGHIRILENGEIKFFSEQEKAILNDFLSNGESKIRSVFSLKPRDENGELGVKITTKKDNAIMHIENRRNNLGSQAKEQDNFMNRDSLFNLSVVELFSVFVQYRNMGDLIGAESAAQVGMERYPDELDQYKGPIFRKELMRMLLNHQHWDKAWELIPEADAVGGGHWHEILFARAYAEAGDLSEAAQWWSRVLVREPTNGEAKAFFSRIIAADVQSDAALKLHAEAEHIRDQGNKVQAEVLFRQGMDLYPNHMDKYGHPAFRKELMRMLLNDQQWDKAETLIPVPGTPGGNHWHYTLFARALKQSGNISSANDMYEMASIESLLEDINSLRGQISKSIVQIHPFMDKFFAYRGMTAIQAATRFFSFVDEAERKLAGIHNSTKLSLKTSNIPKIFHRVWLTNTDSPCEPPEKYIENFIRMTDSSENSEWKFLLWVQDESLLPATVSAIKNSGRPIEVKNIFKEISNGRWRRLLDAFIKDKKYPFAVDVLRMKILQEYGGVYTDMGAAFSDNFTRDFVVGSFKYSFIFWNNMFFQNSLMCMPPSSELANAFIKIVEDPYVLPEILVSPLTGLTEGQAFSGLLITALLLSLPLNEGDVCPLLPNGKVVSWSSQQSWYTNTGSGEGKFGNTYIPTSAPSFLSCEGWADRQNSDFDILVKEIESRGGGYPSKAE
ncbi:glycosyltransferase [Azospirillum argentinense]